MNICLYGASSPALDRAYFDAAEEFGRLLAKNGHTLVYGGGAQGVLGFLQQHLGCSIRLPAPCPKVAKGFGAGIVLRVG